MLHCKKAPITVFYLRFIYYEGVNCTSYNRTFTLQNLPKKMLPLFIRFLALPCLLQAPRDFDRSLRWQPSRRIFEVEPVVLGGPQVVGTPLAVVLDHSEAYRRELTRAHAEVFMVRDLAAPLSVLHHRPISHYRDPVKVQNAKLACNDQDPVLFHLNPLLQQLGLPLM